MDFDSDGGGDDQQEELKASELTGKKASDVSMVNTEIAKKLSDPDCPIETKGSIQRPRSAEKQRKYGKQEDYMLDDDFDFEFDDKIFANDDEYPTGKTTHDEDAEIDEVLYSKSFVNAFFEFADFSQAGAYMVRWFKVLKHNPTEFVGNLDGLLQKGLEFRAETLQKI